MTSSADFDRQVERFEKLRDGGDDFADLRQKLLEGILGDVLEIAPGPGFNFPLYKNISSLTAVDLSPKMIESAEQKWRQVSNVAGTFVVADINDAAFENGQFDAVVSTCSVCAFEDPVAVLNKVADWCKPEGRVYLLEHGLSDFALMRVAQRLYEPIHFKIHACHCNRDVRSIVEESDLEIISIAKPRRYAIIDFMSSIIAKPKVL